MKGGSVAVGSIWIVRATALPAVVITLIVSSPLLATYAVSPSGEMAMPLGAMPTWIVATLECVVRSSTVTVSSAVLVMYAVCPSALTATPWGAMPVAGEASTTKSEVRTMLADPSPLFATTRRGVVQSTIAVLPQTPALQVSPVVQALASSQGRPWLAGCAWQAPAASLQTPVLHWSVSEEQSRGIPPPQVPAVHVSPTLQKSPSLHAVPSPAAGLLQTPVAGSQVPATWHESSAVQTTGVPGWHVPVRHVSPPWRGLPSRQWASTRRGVCPRAMGERMRNAPKTNPPATTRRRVRGAAGEMLVSSAWTGAHERLGIASHE